MQKDEGTQRDGALSIDEFCAEYRVGRTTAYEEINAGRLPAVKVGRRTLIPKSGARSWFQSLSSINDGKRVA
jgi:excisionase family DNA binding protein